MTAGGILARTRRPVRTSGGPQETLHGTAAGTRCAPADCHAVGAPLNIHFLVLGVTPIWAVNDLKRMPKSRYGIMTPYMDGRQAFGNLR